MHRFCGYRGAGVRCAQALREIERGGWMRNTPLFRERPLVLRILTGGVVPVAFGAVTGLVLGVSAAGYWALSLVALAGGVLAGFEHRDGWEGADRGLIGGALFGTGLVVAHALAVGHAHGPGPKMTPLTVRFSALTATVAPTL